MNKTLKETLVGLICIINISMGVAVITFCLQDKPLYAVSTLVLLILLQPLSYNLMNKLT